MQMQFMASWSPMRRWLHTDTSSALPSQDDLSMPYNYTDTSSQSCISMDSSSTTTDHSNKTNMWNHLLLNSGGNMQLDDELNNTGEKFLELLSSKTLVTNVLSDYPKDTDNNMGISHSINHYNGTTQSELVSNWSIAPPMMAQHVMPNPSLIKSMACYNYDLKEEKQQQELFGYHNTNSNQIVGGTSVLGLSNHKLCNEMIDTPWSCSRNLADLISFDSCLNSSSAQTISQRVDSKKAGSEISMARQSSSRSSGMSTESKKRKSEDSSEANSKRPKQQSSTTSKAQVPKVKLLDKIGALQQIVAPFGKTDTASVLLDTFKYIKFLHEQVQLLSDPFIKSLATKDHNAIWGGLEASEKVDQDVDLRSRGLCLIPISCASRICPDNSMPDYWAPPYRSCLFR
ncbi:basic helix-loop-helix (bHLH) DNA-binding superfamily protein [Rhynchospora pubera]|uniref:Basic helix-loop-helix (BHLH) DNA-binding superfamily protein n=1 Tax=Rhynchospora pubera TaxID=906938 RepID=A0AAV8CU58_9POAL|nr:basic helix-loop-helix (bHLH) DNA-binding superfamily protein [Rhynchospora pubera]